MQTLPERKSLRQFRAFCAQGGTEYIAEIQTFCGH